MEDVGLINEIKTEDSIKEERKWCVYIHTSPSGKRYVGITNKNPPEDRWGKNGHNYLVKYPNGKYMHPAMAHALTKYPNWNDWKHEIYCSGLTSELAKQIEIELIKEYRSNDSEYGYNLTLGGDGTQGHIMPEESKKLLSEIVKTRWEDEDFRRMMSELKKGWSPPDAWRAKRSKYMKEKWQDADYYAYMCSVNLGENNPNYGKTPSAETRAKISSSLKGKYIGENNPNYGKKHSEETKQKLRDINTGKHVGELNHMYGVHMVGVESGRHKPVYCIELNEIFWGAKAAEEKYGINRRSISFVCRGERKHAGKDTESGVRLSWMFAEKAVEQNYITQEDLENYLNNLKNKKE